MKNSKTFDGSISSISELLSEVSKSKLTERSHTNVGLWFRGHKNAEWDLRPGVYRKDFNVTDEKRRLEKEQRLTKDFQVLSVGLSSVNASDI